MRKFMIQSNETLLVVELMGTARGDRQYINESRFFQTELTEAQVLHETSDETIRVLRMDVETLAVTDITEEAAQAWIDDRVADGIEIDGGPLFVTRSDAFEEWMAGEETAQSEPDPDYLYEEKRDRLLFGVRP